MGINRYSKASRFKFHNSNYFINITATGDQKLMSCLFSGNSENIIVMQI